MLGSGLFLREISLKTESFFNQKTFSLKEKALILCVFSCVLKLNFSLQIIYLVIILSKKVTLVTLPVLSNVTSFFIGKGDVSDVMTLCFNIILFFSLKKNKDSLD